MKKENKANTNSISKNKINMRNNNKKVAIIGGGASGLVAAIFAAKQKQDVIILEKNNLCGKKILATGNGRCNLWNEDQSVLHYRSSEIQLVEKTLNKENQKKILDFFNKIGIEFRIKNGYYYPFSNQAVSVQNALVSEANKLNIDIKNNTEIKNIKKVNGKFIIYTTNNEKILTDKVIIATGSKAAPKTGSDGTGYGLCENFGHTIVKPLPALVQLRAREHYLKDWEGIRVDALIELYENNKKLAEEKGELQLTNYGISGICVLNLSGRVARGLEEGKEENIIINFLDGLNLKKIENFINWMDNRNSIIENRNILELLEGVLNYKLVKVILKKSKLNEKDNWNVLSANQKVELAKNIIQFDLNIVGTNFFDKAQVCSGGIPLNEIDINTMESKKEKGLYIVGELLDVDGDCGGYNLEWAWTTGMIAGEATSKRSD